MTLGERVDENVGANIGENVSKSLGKFITIEGTEGVGKSTNLGFVRDWLSARGKHVVVTREPGGTPMAEEIRHLLLSNRDESVFPLTELLLIFAARAQHLEQVVKPALARGHWVLCDRFTDSTYAYQGGGRGFDRAQIRQLETLVQDDLRPDMTLILDIDIELGLSRARQRSEPDRFEGETIAFFERVRGVYQELAASAPERYTLVNAGQSLEAVQEDIEQVLLGLMGGQEQSGRQ